MSDSLIYLLFFGSIVALVLLAVAITRRFVLRNKTDKSKQTLTLTRDLVVMSGAAQSAWTHEVPKEKMPCAARINLTFRRILGESK